MLFVDEIQFLIGIGALCVFAILLTIEGNERLRDLFQELSLQLGWGPGPGSAWRVFRLRQLREARVFYHGLPPDPRISEEARRVARQFRRLSFLHMIAGWSCWYIMLALGALAEMPESVEQAMYMLPPIAAAGLRLAIRPWPGGDVWHGEAPPS